jgi:type IV pilus assembly protein PilB
MQSLIEVLVLRGLVPLERLGAFSPNSETDELKALQLVADGVITSSQLASARAAHAGLDYVELLDYPVDPAAVALISPEMCRGHQILPISVNDGEITVAMVNPSDIFALDDVRTATRLNTRAVVVEAQDLRAAINRFVRADGELNILKTTLGGTIRPQARAVVAEIDSFDDAPIVRFVNLLISQGIHDKASDIHIEPGEFALRVRYRIDGVLHEVQSAPKSIQTGVLSRLKIMADIDISERRKPQDGRMSVEHEGRTIDLRVATLPTVFGEKIVLRILDGAQTGMRIADLALLERNFAAYQASYSKPYGLILVTGPTGSGKSTTLYTTLATVSRPEINVITIEDPVEMRIDGINQVQINPKAGLTFASALRSILRADPDVVLLGEIRDHETAQIAIEASLTGHLVLSTLHTNDAPSAITRLTEMGIEPFLVGSALECVVAQRLARRLCERCKVSYHHDLNELSALRIGFTAVDENPIIFRAVGCAVCMNTGYSGRIAIHEVMLVTEEIEKLAVARSSSADISKMARAQGMITLREDGWSKVKLGLTTIDEIIRVVA